MQCWFPALNFLVNVDLLKIADLADTQEMVTLLAYVQMNFFDVKFYKMKKAAMLSKYAMRAGFDDKRHTRSHTLMREARKQEDPMSFTKGFLYSDYQVIEYKPEDLMRPDRFIAAQQVLYSETMLNDCLTLAVN